MQLAKLTYELTVGVIKRMDNECDRDFLEGVGIFIACLTCSMISFLTNSSFYLQDFRHVPSFIIENSPLIAEIS